MTTVDLAPRSATQDAPQQHLLVWDLPNIDATLGDLLGHRPDRSSRPDLRALADWLCTQAAAGARIDAGVFLNVTTDGTERLLPFVATLRQFGFAVFAKPKLQPGDDVDDAIVAHIRSAVADGLTHLWLGSHDAAAFEPLAAELADAGVAVTMLGFAEYAAWAHRQPAVAFHDLGDIPGVLPDGVPRTRLDDLPPEGVWLPATTELQPRPLAQAA